MSDIVERLRMQYPRDVELDRPKDVIDHYVRERLEAADEIETLRTACDMLREANRVLRIENEGLRHEVSVLHAMLKDYERVYGTYGEER